MIVGKYAVNPHHVRYASKRFDPETNMTEITICLDDDTPLSQWVGKAEDVDNIFSAANAACGVAEDIEAQALSGEED